MCCSVTPGVKVRFSHTVFFAAEVLDSGELVKEILA